VQAPALSSGSVPLVSEIAVVHGLVRVGLGGSGVGSTPTVKVTKP
jgi:hypothetical protein